MDSVNYFQFIFALVLVIGLIVGLGWAARRFGFAPRVTLPGAGKAGKADKRLAIVEVLPVDARRRLLLIRRDGTEHLVMIGAERDTVIETGINPGSAAARGDRP
jgi:flagellar protein FliO/FliZ